MHGTAERSSSGHFGFLLVALFVSTGALMGVSSWGHAQSGADGAYEWGAESPLAGPGTDVPGLASPLTPTPRALPPASATPTAAPIIPTPTTLSSGDASAVSGEVITFRQRAVAVGDTARQQFGVRLQLHTQIVQSGQVAHESTNDLGREQLREVEVLEIEDNRLRRARVSFLSCRNQAPGNPDPSRLQPQPIHGKTYLVEISSKGLQVADEEGAIPPLDEFQMVSEALSQLGKPHPLSEYLLERTFTVGQRVLLPRAIAEELLGLEDEVGVVKRFELVLARIEPPVAPGGSPSAVFAATVETLPDDQAPMEMAIVGEIVVETATCRALAANFQGPVKMSSIERTPEGIFQYEVGGNVQVAIRSSYGSEQLAQRPAPLRR